MNAPIRRLSTFVALLFATLLVSTTIITSPGLAASSSAVNSPAESMIALFAGVPISSVARFTLGPDSTV